jgi:hypothetical protein
VSRAIRELEAAFDEPDDDVLKRAQEEAARQEEATARPAAVDAPLQRRGSAVRPGDWRARARIRAGRGGSAWFLARRTAPALPQALSWPPPAPAPPVSAAALARRWT